MARIIIIDDEAHIRLLYGEELEEDGFDVICLESPQNIINIIRSEKPDLIILDIKLTEHNGLDVLQDIRSKFIDLPVILCSAYDLYKEDQRTLAANYYVTKSFDLAELKTKVKMALEVSMPDFSRLSFGQPTAERDIAAGLDEYFVESDSFKHVYSGDKTIILGSRGTGKSAILKVIAKRAKSHGALVVEISPEDFTYDFLNQIATREERSSWAKLSSYSAAWKYLIYILVMKRLVKDKKHPSRSKKAIIKYLRDKKEIQQYGVFDLLTSYLLRIQKIKVAPLEATFDTRELTKLYKVDEISVLIPHIVTLCSQQVFVLIDELDTGWDASDDAKAYIAGLVQSAMSVNQLTSNLKVIIALRREIFDNIPSLYEEAQKLRDVIEYLSWNKVSLLRIIGNRIRHSVPTLVNFGNEECWSLVFGERPPESWPQHSYDYIVQRTLYRPRQIIHLCNDALAINRKEFLWPISYSTVRQAELSYSEGQVNDITAEYKFEYPGLRSIFQVFRGMQFRFSRDELEGICLRIVSGELRVDKTAKWVHEQDPLELVDILWKVGFLEAYAVLAVADSAQAYSDFVGSHQISNLNLYNIEHFRVHPMFHIFLGMKS